MPKRIDEQLKARAVRLVTEHRQEYASLTVVRMHAHETCAEALRRCCTTVLLVQH